MKRPFHLLLSASQARLKLFGFAVFFITTPFHVFGQSDSTSYRVPLFSILALVVSSIVWVLLELMIRKIIRLWVRRVGNWLQQAVLFCLMAGLLPNQTGLVLKESANRGWNILILVLTGATFVFLAVPTHRNRQAILLQRNRLKLVVMVWELHKLGHDANSIHLLLNTVHNDMLNGMEVSLEMIEQVLLDETITYSGDDEESEQISD